MLTRPSLSSTHYALLHRIGLQKITPANASAALIHPALQKSEQASLFYHFKKVAAKVLAIFAYEYVSCRFPKLPRDSLDAAAQIYTTAANVSAVARFIGLEFAIVPFSGIPSIKKP